MIKWINIEDGPLPDKIITTIVRFHGLKEFSCHERVDGGPVGSACASSSRVARYIFWVFLYVVVSSSEFEEVWKNLSIDIKVGLKGLIGLFLCEKDLLPRSS